MSVLPVGWGMSVLPVGWWSIGSVVFIIPVIARLSIVVMSAIWWITAIPWTAPSVPGISATPFPRSTAMLSTPSVAARTAASSWWLPTILRWTLSAISTPSRPGSGPRWLWRSTHWRIPRAISWMSPFMFTAIITLWFGVLATATTSWRSVFVTKFPLSEINWQIY